MSKKKESFKELNENRKRVDFDDVTPPLPRFRTQWNFQIGQLPTDFPVLTSDSQTVPNMALTPQELLQRNAAGLSLFGKEPVYNEFEMPNLKALDLVEIEQERERMREQIKDLEDKHRELSKQQAEAFELQRKKSFDDLIKAYEQEKISSETANG